MARMVNEEELFALAAMFNEKLKQLKEENAEYEAALSEIEQALEVSE